jgi:hypothetical protein
MKNASYDGALAPEVQLISPLASEPDFDIRATIFRTFVRIEDNFGS